MAVNNISGKIISINISDRKGVKKTPVDVAEVMENSGIKGDAHAGGESLRQISLLAIESINKIRDNGLKVGPGDFAENITTEGIDLMGLPLGTRMRIGDIILEVSQIGKLCHTRCAIYYEAGDCVMPREGIFVKVLKGGTIRVGDLIEIIK